MYIFLYYFLLFFLYSFLGWIIETISCSIIKKSPVLNRGFLIGPYCPVYGTAALVMILFLTEYKSDIFNLFIMAVVYASLVEYLASYIMEKIFKARWWDYTNEKFNLNGRICLKNCVAFGILGVILIYFVNPFIESIFNLLGKNTIIIIGFIILFIFLIDLIITIYIISKLNINIRNIKSDATDEIDIKIKEQLSKYKVIYKRLFQAFPKFKYHSKKSNVVLSKLKEKVDELDLINRTNKIKIKDIKGEIKVYRKSKEYDKIKLKKQEIKEIRKRKLK